MAHKKYFVHVKVKTKMFLIRYQKGLRKGEESLDDMITQLQQLQVGGIRRLPKGCDVETRKQQKRVMTQHEMGKKLNTTNSKGSQTLSGFSTSADPSLIPYR